MWSFTLVAAVWRVSQAGIIVERQGRDLPEHGYRLGCGDDRRRQKKARWDGAASKSKAAYRTSGDGSYRMVVSKCFRPNCISRWPKFPRWRGSPPL